MKAKKRLVIILSTAILSSACLANPGGSIPIPLGDIEMVSPGSSSNSKSTTLKPLSDKKFYTIHATLHNTNMQEVDYRITTSYATTSDGSIGNVTTSLGPLTKDGDGYKGHLTSTDQDIPLTITNVRTNHGLVNKDHIELENVTPTTIGSGIELRNISAIEQADSGEDSGNPSNSSDNSLRK